MAGCCGDGGYGAVFGSDYSRRMARRYRRGGLDRTAERMVRFVAEQGISGATVLEIGGGVGGIQVELLRRGAARATNLELVDSYEQDAKALAVDAGVADRVTRRQVDIALTPQAVEPHDVVVLHRVVCCYGDYQRLLGAAAAHATRVLVFSHPPRNLVTRFFSGAENAVHRLRGNPFRTYVHDPGDLVEAAERGDLRAGFRYRGAAWQVVGLAVAPPAAVG